MSKGPMFKDMPPVGQPLTLEDGLLSFILAPNASKMMYWGTNTYLLGKQSVALVDPGPLSDAHFLAIKTALHGRTLSHIIVTHTHKDHSSLAPRLAQDTGAPIYGFGDALCGRSPLMTQLATTTSLKGGEGMDLTFTPDKTLQGGETLSTDEWELNVMHTPGHTGNHIALRCNDFILTGDTVMSWSSSLVSPPDGDMGDFLRSCEALKACKPRTLYTGHGPAIENPERRLNQLISHQLKRREQILALLKEHGPKTPQELVSYIYQHLPQDLLPLAQRNTLAHLIELYNLAQVSAFPQLCNSAQFQRL